MTEVTDLSDKMQRVYWSVAEEGATTPEEMTEITGIKHTTVRTYARRLEKMQLLQRDSHGKYSVAGGQNNGPPEPNAGGPRMANLTKAQLDALGNAGILFRDASTGEVFFSIDFPSYLRVWNPYVIDLENPSTDDVKAQMVQKGEDTAR